MDNLVYMNHNTETNKIKRAELYKMFSNKSWVISEHGKNGTNFDNYLRNIYNHQICYLS